MLIQGKLLSSGDDISLALNVRKKVFNEELGFPEDAIFDSQDAYAIHAVAFQGNDQTKAVASGRIVYDGDSCELSYIGVLKDFRGNQYGDFIVRLLINKAFTAGVKIVYVNAELPLMEFYKKIGFNIGKNSSEHSKNNSIIRMSISSNGVVTKCKFV